MNAIDTSANAIFSTFPVALHVMWPAYIAVTIMGLAMIAYGVYGARLIRRKP